MLSNPIAPPVVPTVANVSYIPVNSPMVAVAGSHPEVGMGTFAPRSSTPSKFVSYGNISAATGVMFGHGQLICLPVFHDLVPSAAAIFPEPAGLPLNPHHVQYPKHQGNAAGHALQLCVPQPFIGGGQAPMAMPSHIPYLQAAFPVSRPLQIPGSNALFSTNLP
ncbi:DEA(D/H)-box RNA helicase family protein isoform 1 [Hibiscus syriacus]|uniref:DEA(D/H)-box RNA helicase family protein isoform 1 n=1 Tax=Hibiscus syriacus TaxID=106335 RepID=A0A6A3CSZ6_HIBSY|nr:DEA(D/H)-box RNA helicase family protein isoform 1 [Hibiscus syriacus]